jgi:tRNA(Arg) A34 adenosine deaminase TadA
MPLPTNSTEWEPYLRHAIAVSARARTNGNHPFGAILVGPDGEVLMEAENSCGTAHDPTGHAERNLMTRAGIAYEAAFLRGCTLVTSAEPCAMCSGSAYWTGVGRVVYGCTEKQLGALIGPHLENLTMDLPCATVLNAGQRRVEIIGPLLADEALRVHADFWTARRSS